MNSPLISIIVPVFNAEKQLPRMLDSAIRQSYVNWEMILVNDGSSDNSESILRKYVHQDLRFRYFTQINSGPSIARNRGIQEAKGKYMTFIDADDWVRPDYLEKLIQPMLKTDTDLVCAGYFEVNPQFPDGLKLHDFPVENFNQIVEKREYQSNLFNGVSGVLWAKLFKKEIFIENNIQLPHNLRFSEDLIAVLDYSRFIKKAFIIPDAIYYYNRLNDDGLSGRLNTRKFQDLDLFFQEMDRFKQELNFLDLNAIKNKRKYSFMIQLLKDHSNSRKEFYEVADFLVKKESPFNSTLLQENKMNNFALKSIFKGNYFQSWVLLRTYQLLKKYKNG